MLTPQQLRIRQLNRRVYLSVATIILTVIAFFAIKAFIERPTDLGPKLEYIGTNYNSGCTLFFCDSPSSTNYYFATDMTRADIRAAIEKTDFKEAASDGEDNFSMSFSNNQKQLYIAYYEGDEKNKIIKVYNLNRTNKSFIVDLSPEDYAVAKEIFHF